MEFGKILYYKVCSDTNDDDLGLQVNVRPRKTDFDEEMTLKVVKFLGRNFFSGPSFTDSHRRFNTLRSVFSRIKILRFGILQ